jgi:hypothetical protein
MIDFIKSFFEETVNFIAGTEKYLKEVFLPYFAVIIGYLVGCFFVLGFLAVILSVFKVNINNFLPKTKPYYIWVYARQDNTDYYYHVKAKVQDGIITKLYLKDSEINIDDKDYEYIVKNENLPSQDVNGTWWDIKYYGEKY